MYLAVSLRDLARHTAEPCPLFRLTPPTEPGRRDLYFIDEEKALAAKSKLQSEGLCVTMERFAEFRGHTNVYHLFAVPFTERADDLLPDAADDRLLFDAPK